MAESSATPSPAPLTLEQEEQRARIKKMHAETDLVIQQLSQRHQRYEWLKVIAGFGGLITAVAAVFGLLLSASQWLESAESTRRLRVEERLDRSLTLMGGESPATRLAAVVSLSSFLKEDKEHAPQVLQALTNALAIEESLTVRNAILAAIERLEPTDLSATEFRHALDSLVLVSRGLIQEGDLWTNRRSSVYTTPSHATVESKALSVATAIAGLLHKGARSPDMSRIYLSGADLSGLNLTGTKWDDSILAWTDFSRAELKNTSFKDADLEGALFKQAHLTKADFSVSLDILTAKRRFNYVKLQMHRSQRLAQEARATESFWVTGPDFSCADLNGANFSGHPLLPIYSNELAAVIRAHMSFRDADISGANFSPLGGFGIVLPGQQYDAQPFPTIGSGASWASIDHYAVTEFVLNNHAPLAPGRANYSQALNELTAIFSGSNWRGATFDRSVRETLDMLNVYHAARLSPCHMNK